MKRFVILLFAVIPFFSQAQVKLNFAKGFVILSNNDTLYGEIKQLPYSSMISNIQFKKSNDTSLLIFTTNHLKGFHIDPNEDFETIEVKTEKRKLVITTKYFAQRIVTGKIDFLEINFPDASTRYFIRDANFGLNELTQTIKVNSTHEITNKKYIFTLGKYMYQRPEIHPKIKECDFNQKQFINLISEYNSDLGTVSVPESKFDWNIHLNVGVDYYLGEKLENKRAVFGNVFGIKNSIYNKKKNLRTELVMGLSYRRFAYNFNIESEMHRFVGTLIEAPIYLTYNNKLQLFSPILEGGYTPYLARESIDKHSSGFKFNNILLLGLGMGLNFDKVSVKYIIYRQPLLQNTLSIEYKLM